MSAGGAERVASVMLQHWAESDVTVELLTLNASAADHYQLPKGISRRVLNTNWDSKNSLHGLYSNFKRLLLIRREILSSAPDVVISFIDRTNIMVLSSLLGSGIPVIVSERIDPTVYRIGRSWSMLRKLVYRFASHVVVQTESAAVWALTHTQPDKISIIQNPVSFLPEPAAWTARKNQVVSMGRMVPQKGFDVLVQAFASSRARDLGWRLVLIGDGPDRKDIERFVQELGIQRLTEFTGVIRAPADVLNESKIFVLASRFEGFPNALLEGMAMGCACVVTDCRSGPAEIVRDMQNGLLVPVEDHDRLTDAINRMVDFPDEAQGYAAQAIEVRAKNSIDQIMAPWDKLLAAVHKQ